MHNTRSSSIQAPLPPGEIVSDIIFIVPDSINLPRAPLPPSVLPFPCGTGPATSSAVSRKRPALSPPSRAALTRIGRNRSVTERIRVETCKVSAESGNAGVEAGGPTQRFPLLCNRSQLRVTLCLLPEPDVFC